MQSAKETASNVAASARSALEKSKATVQEKVEKMSAHDQLQKDMATQKKEERKAHAELNKQEAREQNAAARQAASIGGPHSHPTGTTGYTTGPPQMSAMPGQGTGLVTEGTAVGSHPVGADTGTGDTTARNTGVGGGPTAGSGTGNYTNPGYGTGGTYS